MKKIKLILLATNLFLLIALPSQAQEKITSSKLAEEMNYLDVEDKEIEMMIDSNQNENNCYKNIIQNMVYVEEQNSTENDVKPNKIQALKVAFLSSKLDLKVEESEAFWPMYNTYVDEIKQLKDITNEIEKDEKVLVIRKKYKDNFEKIIGNEKTNTLFKSEKEFKKLMQETLIMQKMNKQQTPH